MQRMQHAFLQSRLRLIPRICCATTNKSCYQFRGLPLLHVCSVLLSCRFSGDSSKPQANAACQFACMSGGYSVWICVCVCVCACVRVCVCGSFVMFPRGCKVRSVGTMSTRAPTFARIAALRLRPAPAEACSRRWFWGLGDGFTAVEFQVLRCIGVDLAQGCLAFVACHIATSASCLQGCAPDMNSQYTCALTQQHPIIQGCAMPVYIYIYTYIYARVLVRTADRPS